MAVVAGLQRGVGGDLDHHRRADLDDRSLAGPASVGADLVGPRMPGSGWFEQLPECVDCASVSFTAYAAPWRSWHGDSAD